MEERSEGGRRPEASAPADAARAAALSASGEIGRKGEGGEGKRRKREREIFYRWTVDVRGVIELRWTNGKRSS
jgi:hypothetical protein